MDVSTTTVGFVGLGVMGKSMARNLLKSGYKVIIYSRTKEKVKDLLSEGIVWKNNPQDIALHSNVVITMVGYPEDVKEVYFGKLGLFSAEKRGSILIDMTTSTPTLAKTIYLKANELGMKSLDAPVSGGDVGAKNGTLSIMVGGDQEVYEKVLPLFQVLGKNIVYQGEAGSGQHTKMCNQIAIASNMIGVMEAVVYAEKAGLNPEKVLQSISQGAAGSWSMSNLIPRVLKGDFAPGFYIKHFIKDMKIAIEEAEKMQLDLPGLQLAKQLYEFLSSQGEDNNGTQALYKYWSYNNKS